MRRSTSALFACLLASLTAVECANAEPQPAKVFSDRMVLQQQLPINIFGSADPGEAIGVEFNGASVTTKTNDKGRWLVKLPAMKADGKNVAHQHRFRIPETPPRF